MPQTVVARRLLREGFCYHGRASWWTKISCQKKDHFYFYAAVATETTPDLMLPWQQWRAKGCPPANQNSRSYRCCTTSGRSRSGNKPTVPGLGFNITALQSTLPPAGPVSCCCSTLSLKVGLALPWANHKQRGRLCAVSVTKSSSSAPLLLVGSCCCSGTATGNPSCDWLSCSYLLTCCLLRLTSLCSFHVTKD